MDLQPFRAGLGKLIAALVSLAFLLTPMASALHVDAAQEAVCKVEPAGEHAETHDAEKHDHANHAHSCGACHFHLISPAGPQISPIASARSVLRPLFAADIGSPLPGELFRPPRA